MKNLFDVINSLESNTAQIAGLKAVAHGCLSRIIYGVTSNVTWRESNANAKFEQTNDRRNNQDGDFGREHEITKDFGFEERLDPMIRIHALTSVWFAAQERCATLALTPYDMPMSPDRMLKFFLENTQGLSPEVVDMLVEATGARKEDIVKLKEVQNLQERERLQTAVPEIVRHFEQATSGEQLGLAADWSEVVAGDIFDSLSLLDQHQLAVKCAEFTKKAKDGVLARVLRTNRISDIGDIKLLDEGLVAFSDFVRSLERANRDEFADLIDAGRTFKTLADI